MSKGAGFYSLPALHPLEKSQGRQVKYQNLMTRVKPSLSPHSSSEKNRARFIEG